MRLLHECADHDYPAANGGDVKRAGYAVPTRQPQFPQLAFKVLHMRFAQTFQPGQRNTLGKPDKSRLHIRWKSGDFRSNGFIEYLYSPGHARLYLFFDIQERGKPTRALRYCNPKSNRRHAEDEMALAIQSKFIAGFGILDPSQHAKAYADAPTVAACPGHVWSS